MYQSTSDEYDFQHIFFLNVCNGLLYTCEHCFSNQQKYTIKSVAHTTQLFVLEEKTNGDVFVVTLHSPWFVRRV